MPTTRQHQFPASLQKRKDELTKARQQMTLFHSPLRTLYHFSFVLLDWSRSLLLYLLSHTILLLLIFALCSLYIIGKLVDGEHRYAIEAVEGIYAHHINNNAHFRYSICFVSTFGFLVAFGCLLTASEQVTLN